MSVPAAPPDQSTEEVNDALEQQFYSAAMSVGTSGSEKLDLLLRKGLYGKHMPAQLKGKRASDAFQQAFDLIGGIPRLALWADKNETAFFALYSKSIQASIKQEVNATIKIDAPWMNPNRLAYQRTGEIIEMPAEPHKPAEGSE